MATLTIDKDGVIRDAQIKVELISAISHEPLAQIVAIVVHQTNSPTTKGTLDGWRTGGKGTGAHFLIGKDGTVYQTVSLFRRCWHVAPIRSRCFEEHNCSAAEQTYYKNLQKQFVGQYGAFTRAMAKHEMGKTYPDRYPGNDDAIGIEIVGMALNRFKRDTAYEPPTDAENKSLQWLVADLLDTLKLQRTDVYRHPQVGYKTAGEAQDPQW